MMLIVGCQERRNSVSTWLAACVVLCVLWGLGQSENAYAQIANTDVGSEPPSDAIYQVNAEDLSLSLLQGIDSPASDQAIWRAIVRLLPHSLLQANVAEFHVFSDGEDETLAYVSQLEDNPNRWLLAIDSIDAAKTSSASFVITLTHELAHILALNRVQVEPGIEADYCEQDFWVEEGCPKSGALILDFFELFWAGEFYAEHQHQIADTEGDDKIDAVSSFFADYQGEFINEYAATDPIEDFAESFSAFVFLPRIASPQQTREWKVDFFYAIPELLIIREHIRANTSVRRERVDDWLEP